MDSAADNYDPSALVDAGCVYTVPVVENLLLEGVPGRIILSWDAPPQMGSATYTYLIFEDDVQISSTNYLTLAIQVEDTNEHCFTVVASNSYGQSDPSSAEPHTT
jgi:hypothetical protein